MQTPATMNEATNPFNGLDTLSLDNRRSFGRPVDAEVHVSFPLVDRPFQPGRIFARCRGRVVRREERNRVAVFFEDVDFIRDERASGIPDAVFAIA
jgi:hypothetical protein